MNTSTLSAYDNGNYLQFTDYAIVRRDLEILNGIISGIVCDKKINAEEYKKLQNWISASEVRHRNPMYANIIDVLTDALDDDIITQDESENIQWLCHQMINRKKYYTTITASIQSLIGILKGISFDDRINAEEVAYLQNWMEENDHLRNSWPYDELYSFLTYIMEDGEITQDEHDRLLEYCKSVSGDEHSGMVGAPIIMGFCQVDPQITIPERSFCITGVSKKHKRKEIAEEIELYGGYMQNNISKKLNYLVICDERNTCWAFSCYGRKVEQVNTLRMKGAEIAIVHENDLYDAIQDLEI